MTEARMDGYIVQGGLGMARGSLARIEDGRGMLLYVWDGGLWITQERDSRDYYVKPGEWFRLGRNGVVLAYALSRSSVTVTAPVPSHYARRIVLGARVIYDRGQEPGGWREAARQRLTRLWAGAFAPFSRPTTAAL
jgi:hypothetical protein